MQLPAEIEAYTKDFWSGKIYLDPGREFYRVAEPIRSSRGSS